LEKLFIFRVLIKDLFANETLVDSDQLTQPVFRVQLLLGFQEGVTELALHLNEIEFPLVLELQALDLEDHFEFLPIDF
jgi:hypothetical protein